MKRGSQRPISAGRRYDNSDGRLRGRKLTATRRRIWLRDPHCAMCRKVVDLAYKSRDPFELDHIKAVSDDGSNEDDNLQVLCVSFDEYGNKSGCHVDKTNKEQGYKERVEFDTSGRVVW